MTLKSKIFVYFYTYGRQEHDVLVVQDNGEVADTMYSHKMYHVHRQDFGRILMEAISPYLNENYEIHFVDNPSK
jgi:enterochelin esterase-like enzyme